MRPRAKFSARSLRPVLAGLLVAATTITCSIGAGNSSDPFIAPNGQVSYLVSPTPTPEEFDPPEAPEPIADAQPEDTPVPEISPTPLAPILYTAQAGDTLPVVAIRFGVLPEEIRSTDPLPSAALLTPNQLLIIPNRLKNTTLSQRLLPDSEVVFSPSATDFDIDSFVQQAGGYLSRYTEYLKATGTTTGAQVIRRVAIENSINPRLLLSLLEYQSHWVYGEPGNLAKSEYPMGNVDLSTRGLYSQLVWAIKQLSIGYYGWREGLVTDIAFPDGVTARLAPELNAGTVALQYYFAKIYDTQGWVQALDPTNGLPALHARMFGNYWVRAVNVEPLYPPGLTQPPLILPFLIGQMWSFSGGPHGAWEHEGARAALDFAPGSTESGCVASDSWAVASASGLVVRSGNGVVVLDLDGDGFEQTGWVMLYLHISTNGRVQTGTWMEAGDYLGHPSCEGGIATGTHVHIARKYNGEWIPADGPIPFDLNGWTAHAGAKEYEGYLSKGNNTIPASVFGSFESRIYRQADGQ